MIFLRRFLHGACLLGAVASGCLGSPATRPNIIVILADDAGYSDFGCYGGEIPTPHIDALAKTGIRFAQFYTNAVCGPTRASLLTGLYPQQVGHNGRNWNDATDLARSMTIAEALQSSGYHTMLVGTWMEPELPRKAGFDRFFGQMSQALVSYFNEVRDNQFFLDENPWQPPAEFYLTDLFTERAVEFVDQALAKPAQGEARKPFFLYVTHVAPHWPLHAREADIAPHREKYQRLGWERARVARVERQKTAGLIPSTWRPAPVAAEVGSWEDEKFAEWQAERMAVYAAQVTSLDHSVGRIMAAVRRAGALDNTLVLFLSDNGADRKGDRVPTALTPRTFAANLAQPGWRLDGVPMRIGCGPDLMPGPGDTFDAYGPAWMTVSNAPFRDGKASPYEGGVRGPLIANWPRVIRATGRIEPAVSHVMDLMPTLLDVAGVSYPSTFNQRRLLPLEGRSLAPAFRGETLSDHEELCWRLIFQRGMRFGRWKWIQPLRGNQPAELYDILADGGESTNLATQHPDVVKDLRGKVATLGGALRRSTVSGRVCRRGLPWISA